MLLVKTCQIFLYLDLVKTKLEIMLNKVWDRKDTVLDYKNEIFLKSQKWHFSKGVNPAFGQKMQCFKFVFGQKRTRNKV